MGAVQSSSCVSARWRQPKLTNVEIVVYRLYMNDRDVVCEGLVYRCVVEDLKFFTQISTASRIFHVRRLRQIHQRLRVKFRIYFGSV